MLQGSRYETEAEISNMHRQLQQEGKSIQAISVKELYLVLAVSEM